MQNDIVKQPKKEEANPVAAEPAQPNPVQHEIPPVIVQENSATQPEPASSDKNGAAKTLKPEAGKQESAPHLTKNNQKNPKKSTSTSTLPVILAVIVCIVLAAVAVYSQVGNT